MLFLLSGVTSFFLICCCSPVYCGVLVFDTVILLTFCFNLYTFLLCVLFTLLYGMLLLLNLLLVQFC